MRNKTVLCDKCYGLINITDIVENYYETPEEETIDTIECEECHTINEVYWERAVDFSSRTKNNHV